MTGRGTRNLRAVPGRASQNGQAHTSDGTVWENVAGSDVPNHIVRQGTSLYDAIKARCVNDSGFRLFSHPERTQLYRAVERDGSECLEPLNRWGAPRVEAIVRVERDSDDAGEDTYYLVALTGRADAPKLVTESEINSGKAWAKWAGIAISSRAQKDAYANAVKIQADMDRVPIAHIETLSGCFLDAPRGEWRYMLPDGRILPPRPGDVQLPEIDKVIGPLLRAEYARDMPALPLPLPTQDEADTLLDFYEAVSVAGHMLISVGAAFRALASTFLPAAGGLIAEGEPGSGKTASGLHARGVVGPSSYRSEPDAKFTGTAVGMEADLASLSDTLAVVDNFRIKPTDTEREIQQLGETLDRVLMAAYDLSEIRPRGKRNGRKAKGHRLRCVVLVNGERLPDTLLSTLRRVSHLPYEKSSACIDTDALKEREAAVQPILTRAGHAVIAYLLHEANTDANALRARLIRWRDEAITHLIGEYRGVIADSYRSVPEVWAEWLVGLRLAATALVAVAGVDAPLYELAYPHVARFMLAQLDNMQEHKTNEDGYGPAGALVARFAAAIREGKRLDGQQWLIEPLVRPEHGQDRWPRVTGQEPRVWGYHNGNETAGTAIAGYISADGREVYLSQSGRAYLLALAAKTPGAQALARGRALFEALEQEGWVTRRGDTQHLGYMTARGRLWALSADKWLGLDVSPALPPEDGPDADPASAGGLVAALHGRAAPVAVETAFAPCAVCRERSLIREGQRQVCARCAPMYEAMYEASTEGEV